MIKKTILSLIGLSVISLVFTITVVLPLFNGIKEASNDLFCQKAALASFEAKTQNIQDFKVLYETEENNLTKIDDLFINSAEPINFIEFLEEESFNENLTIEISPLAPQTIKDDIWPSMNFKLNLFGSFPDFLKFFDKLEASPYLIEILNLNLRGMSVNELKREELKSFLTRDVEAVLLIKIYIKE